MRTGLSYQTHSDSRGHYTFPVLPVGQYGLDIKRSGFAGYKRDDIILDTSAALTLDASLKVGDVADAVKVTDDTLHVETTSTQLGQVISGRQMTAVPLNGRQLHRSAFPAGWRRTGDIYHLEHGAGCRRHDP